ncbi:YlqD family protein [Halobacillus sp. Marseille-Q1614]|uniref:YlqD family protein n=1 Tax=Halobacillus sp. Marseille-Q1614 TaxID=2709134 RepID=UPI00156FAAB7|nr:YlqD family protein [Halobacillus sp. Marseille-Q1614]
MQIIQRIPVKEILTDDSRQALKDRLNSKYERLDKECQQLKFQQKKLERSHDYEQNDVRQRFVREISRRQDAMKRIQFQLNQLDVLPAGEELKVDEVETIVELEEGDSYEEVVNKREIVIKDGIVIRAR